MESPISSQAYPPNNPPPDFSALVGAYSLYFFDGTYTTGGVTYDYRYIYVVDNKGYNRLKDINHKVFGFKIDTKAKMDALAVSLIKQTATSLVSKFFPKTGIVLSWSLAVIDPLITNQNSTFHSNTDLYTLTIGACTTMKYYYVYNYGWQLIATAASIEYTETHDLYYFYGTTLKTPRQQSSATLDCSEYYWWYIQQYNTGIEGFATGSEKISIQVNYNNTTYNYAPPYAVYPAYLMQNVVGVFNSGTKYDIDMSAQVANPENNERFCTFEATLSGAPANTTFSITCDALGISQSTVTTAGISEDTKLYANTYIPKNFDSFVVGKAKVASGTAPNNMTLTIALWYGTTTVSEVYHLGVDPIAFMRRGAVKAVVQPFAEKAHRLVKLGDCASRIKNK